MRIRIDADPVGSLSILPELPDARLAMLEGLNGIGKTLAIRLLMLCTGVMPYVQGSPAWASLCRGLGSFTVTVTGLTEVEEIQWVGDSRNWQMGPVLNGTTGNFFEITIDGRPATVDEVREHFIVTRLGGEEGLIETFAARSDKLKDVVARWQRRYADQQEGPLRLLEDAVAASEELLGGWSRDRVVELSARVEDARKELISAGKLTDEAQQNYEARVLAAKLSQQLREIREQAPDLREELNKVDSEISEIREEIERLRVRVSALSRQSAIAQPMLKELTNARRTVQTRRRQLAEQTERAAVIASKLDVSTEQNAANAKLAEIRQELSRLQAQRNELDAAPQVRNLIERTVPLLTQAEGQGLGDQLVIENTESPLELTILQTRIGMQNRHGSLEGQPPPPETREVDEQIRLATTLMSLATTLLSALRDRENSRELVARNEDRVNKALAAINPNAIDEMQKLGTLRLEAEERLVEWAAQRAVLAQQLGNIGEGNTETSLASQLESSLQELGLSEDELGPAVAEAEASLNLARVKLNQVQDGQKDATREFALARADIRRSSEALDSDPHLAWVRQYGLNTAELKKPDPVEQATAIGLVRGKVEAVKDRLGFLRGQLAALEAALNSISGELRGDNPSAIEYVEELQSWLSRHFSNFFNTGKFRQELFPQAEGNISVDLMGRDVSWLEKDVVQRRPLEAFSSGEQAFAYTRARLEALDDEEVQVENRLIALDEFGAFIAHDRLTELLSYLKDRAVSHPRDQILVMLPLGRDYEQLATTTIGVEAEMYALLAQEVAAKKYAVRVLEP